MRLKIPAFRRISALFSAPCGDKELPRPDIGQTSLCGRDGMVDIPDLKSEGRMPVGVRVPPPAPLL